MARAPPYYGIGVDGWPMDGCHHRMDGRDDWMINASWVDVTEVAKVPTCGGLYLITDKIGGATKTGP